MAEGPQTIQVTCRGDQCFTIAGQDMTITQAAPDRFTLASGARQITLSGRRLTGHVVVFYAGQTLQFGLIDPLAPRKDEAADSNILTAPMPGAVRLVAAAPGQKVAKGETLVVLEAMKMEHSLTAPRDGTVAEVLTELGAQVEDGAMLLRLDEADASAES